MEVDGMEGCGSSGKRQKRNDTNHNETFGSKYNNGPRS